MDEEQAAALAAVDERFDRAHAALTTGHPRAAREELLVVLAELGALPRTRDVVRRRARVLGLVGMVEFEEVGADAALARLDDAAATAAEARDEELVALTWSQRARVLAASGRPEAALNALDHAVAQLESLGPRDRTIVLMNRGVCRMQAGDLDGAVRDLEQAAALAGRHELRSEQFMALHNAGYLWHLLGDTPRALQAMQEADALDVDVSRGISLLDRGRALLEAGLVDEAHDVLTTAVDVNLGDGQHQAASEARYELARAALLMGRTDEALTHLERAEASFDERTTGAWVLRCRLARLGLRFRRAHSSSPGRSPALPASEAHELVREAGSLLEEASTSGAALRRMSLVAAAEAHALAGDPASAERLLPRDDDAALPLLTVRLNDRRARAALALASGDRAGAGHELAAAADELAAASLSASTLDLRTARLAHATVLSTVDLALGLDEGPAAALAVIDRWRACSARLPPLRPVASTGDAALLARRRRLRDELRDSLEEADLWAELARVEAEIAARRRTVTAAHPDGDDPLREARPEPVEDLLAALVDDDRDLLVTAEHGGRVLAVSLVDATLTLRDLGRPEEVVELARRVRADLQVAVTAGRGPLGATVRASLQHAATTLAARLLDDGVRSGRRLLVCTHGDLAGLPWGLLAPGRPVVLASSPSAWHRTRTRGPDPIPRPADDIGAARRRDTGGGPGPVVSVVRGPRLVASDDEARGVAAVWGVAAPTSDQASDALVGAMAGADLVHVVAHGQHHRQQPLFSSLALADGPCCLYDLEATGVRARQVVLAACDAARVSVRPGDEPLGLSAGLLALGARSVVAPVAPVPDEILPPVMERLHAALAAGVPTDEALVAATADASPLTGAFVVSGSAQRLVGARPAG